MDVSAGLGWSRWVVTRGLSACGVLFGMLFAGVAYADHRDGADHEDPKVNESFTLSGMAMRNGEAVRDARVSLVCFGNGAPRKHDDRTRRDGSFVLQGLESGRVPPKVSLSFFDSSGKWLNFERQEPDEKGFLAASIRLAEAAEVQISCPFGQSEVLPIPATGSLGEIRLESTGKLTVVVPELLGGRSQVTFTMIGPDGKMYDFIGRELDAPPQYSGFKGRVVAPFLAPGGWRVTVTTEDGRSWSATPTVVAEEAIEVTLRADSDGGP